MFWEFIGLFAIALVIFKMGQSYERSKPAITFKFTCLKPRCNMSVETNNHDETVKLANEHAKVHRELEKQ